MFFGRKPASLGLPYHEPWQINGFVTRPKSGECPNCKAPENNWCKSDCILLDPMDYR